MSDKKKVHYQGDIDRCGVTRKIRFKSYGHAKWRAKEILNNEGRSLENQANGFRIYECIRCGGWHLSTNRRSYEKFDVDKRR